jgi:hypothetical protein
MENLNNEQILINLQTHLGEMIKRYSKNKIEFENKMKNSRTQKEMREYYNWYHYYEGKVDIIDSILGNIQRNEYDKPTKEYEIKIKNVYEN